MQQIAILGSTGSIGTQALEVMALHRDRFSTAALVAHSNAELLFEQVRTFRPQMAGLVVKPDHIPQDLAFCQWVFGPECLEVGAQWASAQAVLVSVVGFAGLDGVLWALGAGKRVLVANKEPLVAAGSLVMAAAKQAGQMLYPVDSEHSAIFQCLQGAGPNKPQRLWLTASGGPFRTWSPAQIQGATLQDALRHPNWAMGKKITIDSASMMNKALEIIEARWLFDMPPEKISVVVHPQSVIHSMVAYEDGAVMAQLGTPDMRLPILYAMAWPQRLPTGAKPLSPALMQNLTFEEPDLERFPALRLAYEALAAGDGACAVLNAANEVAVEAFLGGRIPFVGITRLVEEALSHVAQPAIHTVQEAKSVDEMARAYVLAHINA